MSTSKNFFLKLQNAICEVLYEDNLEINQIIEVLEEEFFEEEFSNGYIDIGGVQMALDLLGEEDRVFFDNRTDKYCLLD